MAPPIVFSSRTSFAGNGLYLLAGLSGPSILTSLRLFSAYLRYQSSKCLHNKISIKLDSKKLPSEVNSLRNPYYRLPKAYGIESTEVQADISSGLLCLQNLSIRQRWVNSSLVVLQVEQN